MEESHQCPNCGAVVTPDESVCSICGEKLHHEHTYRRGGHICEVCGAYNPKGTELCNSCQTPIRDVVRANLLEEEDSGECIHWSDEPSSAGRTARVYVAGIMVMVAGALGIAQAVLSLTPGLRDDFLGMFESLIPGMESANNLIADYVLLQAAIFICGVIAIVGSMFTLNLSQFKISVAGAVFGIFAIGIFLGAFFSFLGLMLILTSRKQFMSECG